MTEVPKKILIEGLDRLGKSTLVESIQNRYGFYQKIHFGKPQALEFYDGSLYEYQYATFTTLMHLLRSDARLIFDRAHLGEVVYSPLYRKYDGNYVFELEKRAGVKLLDDVLLILLVEDFSKSKHFVDDGLSFDVSKRVMEQQLFMGAFDASQIKNKKKICVTDPVTGQFRSKEDILTEALGE